MYPDCTKMLPRVIATGWLRKTDLLQGDRPEIPGWMWSGMEKTSFQRKKSAISLKRNKIKT